MTDHLQAAKALMADRPDDGDVFAAQTHAMIAIAESLRSGTIERTETVTHYEPFQIPCERCAGSGTDPEARPDAQNRPQTAQEPEPAGPPCRKCGLQGRINRPVNIENPEDLR